MKSVTNVRAYNFYTADEAYNYTAGYIKSASLINSGIDYLTAEGGRTCGMWDNRCLIVNTASPGYRVSKEGREEVPLPEEVF